MAERTLEQRVAALEKEMAELRAALTNGARYKNWERTVGMFTGDAVMRRIDEAALKFREADRRKSRKAKGQSTKS